MNWREDETVANSHRLGRAAWAMRVFALGMAFTVVGCETTKETNSTRVSLDRPTVSADILREYAATYRYSGGNPRSIKFSPDGKSMYFLRSPARSNVSDLFVVDVQTGEERALLTAAEILAGTSEEISAEEQARRERLRISAKGIVGYHVSPDGTKLLVPLSGKLYIVSVADGGVEEIKSQFGFPLTPKWSPDGNYIATVRDKELVVHDLANGTESKLTTGSSETVSHASAEFVAQEEMGRHAGFWWSPDSRHIAYQRTDTTGMETMYIADALKPEKKPASWPYPRPGKKNASVTLGVISVEGGETTWIDWDRDTYPYLATVRWSEESPLTLLVQNRRQTEQVLLRVQEGSGATETLLTEEDDAWINLDQKMPYWLPGKKGFLWMTEKSGAWQLELRDIDGKFVRVITPNGFNMKGFIGASLKQDWLEVYLSGGENPIETHLFRRGASLSGSRAPTWESLTDKPGIHSMSLAKTGDAWLHTARLMDGTRFQRVRDSNGDIRGTIRSNAETPPFVPRVQFVNVGSSPDYHTAVIRPRDFQNGRKYPVLVYVYGGPHAQVVQADPMRFFRQQWLADHGFIVVSIDGRGTPGRGRNWERAIKKNLIELPLEDQARGLALLAEKFPEIDDSRVGIFGWSFGGYFSAMAVLMRPDVYHVGIAGAPVTDWYDYDTHYTERYMDIPSLNEEGYHATSAMTYASKLTRPLMLIHGTADDNVYFKHSLNLSKALFDAGQEHDMVVLSGFTHMARGPEITPRLNTKMIRYFQKHLQ
ncbi:MAG: DPP IV N-terminal domain-containing protein [Phycisphaerae bacterium]